MHLQRVTSNPAHTSTHTLTLGMKLAGRKEAPKIIHVSQNQTRVGI